MAVIIEKDGVERTFTGIGDAAPTNVAPAMQTCADGSDPAPLPPGGGTRPPGASVPACARGSRGAFHRESRP